MVGERVLPPPKLNMINDGNHLCFFVFGIEDESTCKFDVDKLRFASTGCKLHLLRITEGNLLTELQNFECLKLLKVPH